MSNDDGIELICGTYPILSWYKRIYWSPYCYFKPDISEDALEIIEIGEDDE